jgi:protein associated with RNAse G/E
MRKTDFWNEGETILLRGVYDGHPVYMQSARVIKDTAEETALLIWPGAECMVPDGYIHHAHDASKWDRWQETMTNTIRLEKFIWHTNRFLILLEPEKFYSTIYIWNAASNEFVSYYINFQLPIQRTQLGFDTLDLDLDMVIEDSHTWQWKDMNEYERGIHTGGIQPDWVKNIEQAQQEVFTRIKERAYPLDASWLNWRPDPAWDLPRLPENWDQTA